MHASLTIETRAKCPPTFTFPRVSQVRSSNERYSNLRAACDALLERLSAARDRQRAFDDNVYSTQTALMGAEARAKQVRPGRKRCSGARAVSWARKA